MCEPTVLIDWPFLCRLMVKLWSLYNSPHTYKCDTSPPLFLNFTCMCKGLRFISRASKPSLPYAVRSNSPLGFSNANKSTSEKRQRFIIPVRGKKEEIWYIGEETIEWTGRKVTYSQTFELVYQPTGNFWAYPDIYHAVFDGQGFSSDFSFFSPF